MEVPKILMCTKYCCLLQSYENRRYILVLKCKTNVCPTTEVYAQSNQKFLSLQE